MSNIKFEIKKHFGVISEGTNGWKKEINLVSWNDKEPKIDIRDWNESHEKMSKGITMTIDEFKAMKNIVIE